MYLFESRGGKSKPSASEKRRREGEKRRTKERIRTPEQRNYTDEHEAHLWRHDCEVDNLRRDEDTPVTEDGGDVGLSCHHKDNSHEQNRRQ